MALDTEIRGDAPSVEAAATWLRGSLAPSVRQGADTLTSARSDASSDWDGPAGTAFAATMGSAVGRADDLSVATTSVAAAIDGYAHALRRAQTRMSGIRAAAAAAGLTVRGNVIENPGPGPERPGPLVVGPDTPPGVVLAHDQAVRDYDEHQDEVRAWNTAVQDAAEVRDDLSSVGEGLADEYQGLSGPHWVLTAADIAGGSVGGVLAFNANALRGTADILRQQAVRNLDRALAVDPRHTSRARWYRDVDESRRALAGADDLARSGDDLARTSRSMPLKLGGGLALAGIGYDIAQGKDPVQATVSGAGGFAASVAAGALVGGAVGSVVPVGGTIVGGVVGAVVGAGVGIFTSGAIDSLFEEGPDVGAALDAGMEAVGDTADAIGDGLGAVGGAIGGLFD